MKILTSHYSLFDLLATESECMLDLNILPHQDQHMMPNHCKLQHIKLAKSRQNNEKVSRKTSLPNQTNTFA